jgi:hypothetical protein
MTMARVVTAKSRYARWAGAVGLMLGWLVPVRAFACPMCFGGNNQNQEAFLYGSLFLMIVPVVSIGSLLYWAYRRTKALENLAPPPTLPTAPTAPYAGPTAPQALRLRVVGRR